MNKIDQISKAKSLLASALAAARQSLANGQVVQDARSHMKVALRKLGEAEFAQNKRKMNAQEHQKWWDHIVSGTADQMTAKVADQPSAKVAQQQTLAQLNSLISQEEKLIQDLDKKQPEELLEE
jgi:hypothetical protein